MKILILVALLVTMITVSCCTSKKRPSHYPDDFKFILKRTSFEYDSQTHKYNYYDKSIIVVLTDRELNEIYNYAKGIEYLNFPNEFQCTGNDFTVPCFTDNLEVQYNNKHKQVVNDDCCSKVEKDRPASFDRLVGKITDILDSKEQVKNLPKYDIIYM